MTPTNYDLCSEEDMIQETLDNQQKLSRECKLRNTSTRCEENVDVVCEEVQALKAENKILANKLDYYLGKKALLSEKLKENKKHRISLEKQIKALTQSNNLKGRKVTYLENRFLKINGKSESVELSCCDEKEERVILTAAYTKDMEEMKKLCDLLKIREDEMQCREQEITKLKEDNKRLSSNLKLMGKVKKDSLNAEDRYRMRLCDMIEKRNETKEKLKIYEVVGAQLKNDNEKLKTEIEEIQSKLHVESLERLTQEETIRELSKNARENEMLWREAGHLVSQLETIPESKMNLPLSKRTRRKHTVLKTLQEMFEEENAPIVDLDSDCDTC